MPSGHQPLQVVFSRYITAMLNPKLNTYEGLTVLINGALLHIIVETCQLKIKGFGLEFKYEQKSIFTPKLKLDKKLTSNYEEFTRLSQVLIKDNTLH